MSDLELKWQENIDTVKRLYKSQEINQMRIAELALEVCEISWGGNRKGVKEENRYTLTRFAEEVGINAKTLSGWITIRKTVFDKLPLEIKRSATMNSLTNTAKRVSSKSSDAEVLSVYEQMTSDSMEVRMRRYLADLRAIHYNFHQKNAADKSDHETLQEYLFYINGIRSLIIKKGITPKDNAIAGRNHKRHMSAAEAMGIERGIGESIILKNNGKETRITPKDRDIIHFLKKNKRFFGPTEISIHFKKGENNTAWSHRSLNKLLYVELVKRNNRGHYKWVGAK